VKKLLQVERAGRDIEKVLQRYLFGLTTHTMKNFNNRYYLQSLVTFTFQTTAFVKL
jgi:hypothetical protein